MKNIIHKISWSIKEKVLSAKKSDIRRERLFPEPNRVKSCLVVWKTHPNERVWLEKIKQAFPNKKTDLVCITSKDFQGDAIAGAVYVGSDDVDMKGKIANPRLNELLEKKHDLLIDLNREPEVLPDFVVRTSHALCKASMVKETEEIDVMVDGVADETEFIAKLAFVLSRFKPV